MECRDRCFGPCLPRPLPGTAPGRGSTVAVSFVWKAGTTVGATEQDPKIDGVIVLQCFGASCFCSPQFSSCLAATSFLNFVCPVFPFKSTLFFLLTFPCLSLPFSFYLPFNYVFFDIFAATAPFLGGVDIQKYLVGRGAQGWHAGEEFKFSYQRCLIFVWLLFIYLSEQDVLGSCLESLFWQTQILSLTFPSLMYLLFFSRPVTSLLKASISVHLPVISRSGLSEVINELCWPLSANRAPFHHASMQGYPTPAMLL